MQNTPIAEKVFTPANIVTACRIALIPVFVFVILAPWPGWLGSTAAAQVFGFWQPWISAAVFAVLALTDGVDGYLARSRNQVTTLGKFLDPLADKILVTAALLALIELGSLPAWVALVIIAREFLVSGLRMVASAEGQVIAASPLGKVKTWTQIIAVLLFIIKSGTWAKTLPSEIYLSLYVVAWAIMLVALVMTLWSMIDYFVKARRLLGFAQDEQVEQKLTERVITAALATGQTIATAESLTGGLIGAALTSVPGSSAVYVGGVNSYTEQVKMAELGVKADTLSRYTVVSEPVAREMAQGALDKFKTDLAVSVTGVAGPGGGSEATPVGTVCHGIAWRDARGKAQVKTYTKHYPGDRASVRRQTMEYALQLLLERLDA